jgi:tetratricopeptide (TPR) repeat protein
MDLINLIRHPELMDRETLYDLRSLIAQYPYYQTARLLMLKNLYILHDPTFDEELRRAAIYITDRKVIFNLVESAHYQLKTTEKTADEKKQTKGAEQRPSTNELIDKFLETIPVEEEKDKSKKRKPTAADAAIDYVAYLLETEEKEDVKSEETESSPTLDLIDTFISNNEQGRIELKENIEYVPEIADEGDKNGENEDEEGYFTETLARIYIKQGRYSQALEIIKRLNLAYPKKNAYFADQIRFLEKLIVNSGHKKEG